MNIINLFYKSETFFHILFLSVYLICKFYILARLIFAEINFREISFRGCQNQNFLRGSIFVDGHISVISRGLIFAVDKICIWK